MKGGKAQMEEEGYPVDSEEYSDIADGMNEEEDLYPEQKQPSNLFSLFKSVLKMKDSTKVANLSKDELGSLGMPVRGNFNVALISEVLDHPGVAEFFERRAEILNATSMSKDGWLGELFVSQKKFQQRTQAVTASTTTSIQQQPNKKTIWPQKQNQ
jgi:hypothetical protein